MDLTILEKYQGHFPSCSDIIAEFPQLYHKKLIFLYLDSGMNFQSK